MIPCGSVWFEGRFDASEISRWPDCEEWKSINFAGLVARRKMGRKEKWPTRSSWQCPRGEIEASICVVRRERLWPVLWEGGDG